MASVFLVAFFSSIILQKTGEYEHITAIFIFAVFLTSILTDGYIYGIVSALVGTLAVNYAYTYPFYALDFRFQSNMISAVVMMAIAVLTGMLTTQVKTHEAIKAESEKERMRANLLRAVGDSLTPLAFLGVSAILNVVLDLIFVLIYAWGIQGAAIATVIAGSIFAFFKKRCYQKVRSILEKKK